MARRSSYDVGDLKFDHFFKGYWQGYALSKHSFEGRKREVLLKASPSPSKLTFIQRTGDRQRLSLKKRFGTVAARATHALIRGRIFKLTKDKRVEVTQLGLTPGGQVRVRLLDDAMLAVRLRYDLFVKGVYPAPPKAADRQIDLDAVLKVVVGVRAPVDVKDEGRFWQMVYNALEEQVIEGAVEKANTVGGFDDEDWHWSVDDGLPDDGAGLKSDADKESKKVGFL